MTFRNIILDLRYKFEKRIILFNLRKLDEVFLFYYTIFFLIISFIAVITGFIFMILFIICAIFCFVSIILIENYIVSIMFNLENSGYFEFFGLNDDIVDEDDVTQIF